MDIADFNRVYHVRAPSIMWLLGAGASAAANVPTAGDMTWDFKRRLYCSLQRVSLAACSDLGDPELQRRVQAYFDRQGTFPPAGAADEYAAYFEAMYPDESDRRRHIDGLVASGRPSFGHVVLAALFQLDKARVVWTTNFDRVIEDAAVQALGSTGRLRVATPDTALIARDSLNEERWPLLVKLHGDFQSRRLSNTLAELREHDAELRHCFVDACSRFGLAVIGYSGRDDSVMSALEAALNRTESRGVAYPAGLFWMYRADSPPSARVSRLIETAAARGVDAHLVEVETFDELMGDLTLLLENIPEDVSARIEKQRPSYVSDVAIPAPGSSYPVVRLNALQMVESPKICRRVVCQIGGAREVHDTVAASGADILVARRQVGVLAFGRDAEVRRAFADRTIETFDLHSIEHRRLRYADSAEMGLILSALARALARERPVLVVKRRERWMVRVDGSRATHDLLGPLRKAAGGLTGEIKTPNDDARGLEWAEATPLRVEERLGRLWLLLIPTIWVASTEDDVAFRAGVEFVRQRQAARFNQKSNAILDGWVHLVTGGSAEATLSAFGISEAEGIDARFTICGKSAFSRRATHGRVSPLSVHTRVSALGAHP